MTVVRQSKPISSTQLYKDVTAFRAVLTDPAVDPRPLGRKLYDLLIAPIKPDVDNANAKTLLFTLDDALRYIPIAALVDPSEQYVVQTYKTEAVSLLDDSVAQSALSPGQVLGLGTSVAHTIGEDTFPALPGVAEELTDIVRQTGEMTGVVPGERLLDDDFTQSAMEKGFSSRRFGMVHVASHFAIGLTDTSSYLLLGDGTQEYVSDMRKVPDRFAGVDLLTLSACDTNEDIATHDGHEIDGFETLMSRWAQGMLSPAFGQYRTPLRQRSYATVRLWPKPS